MTAGGGQIYQILFATLVLMQEQRDDVEISLENDDFYPFDDVVVLTQDGEAPHAFQLKLGEGKDNRLKVGYLRIDYTAKKNV